MHGKTIATRPSHEIQNKGEEGVHNDHQRAKTMRMASPIIRFTSPTVPDNDNIMQPVDKADLKRSHPHRCMMCRDREPMVLNDDHNIRYTERPSSMINNHKC